MPVIRHEVWIDAPRERVYECLGSVDGVSRWWDTQIERITPRGPAWEHSPGPAHGVVQMLVLAREPGRMLQWQCISAHDASTPASEWTGTTITFALGERASSAAASGGWARQIPVQTVLSFTHQGWKEGARFFAFCNTAWGTVLQQLKDCASLEPHH
ncbi:MAG: SRPBCC domain-containing protein [Alcaligenaceae bacterium]|nr:MAG: SRPBCC domain-containing protein [Alcaligenaceae bacterium]